MELSRNMANMGKKRNENMALSVIFKAKDTT
jgi:hypothetical protein